MKEDQSLPGFEPLHDCYAFGPFRLDAKKRRLCRGDDHVALTPKAFDTLLALVGHAGQVVDKDDLLKIVWPDTFVAEETLTQNISTIRKALGDTSDHPEYIATLPRRGYQFIGVLTIPDLVRTQSPALLATSEDAPSHHTLRPARLNRRERLLRGIAAVAIVVGVVLGIAYYLRPTRIEMPFGNQWQINPPTGTTLISSGVLSPDGRSVAFVTTDHSGRSALWVQGLMSLEPHRLPGTDDARDPFWSPDGGSIAFSAGTKLKSIGLTDKAPQTLAEVGGSSRGGAWSPNGVILYPITNRGPLYQIKADRTFEPVTRLIAGERAHLWPCFLPDGRHFLFRAVGFNSEQSGTYIGSLGSNERTRLLDGASSAAIYAEPGYLLFVRDGALLAQRFDLGRRVLNGPTFVVAPNVEVPGTDFGGTFSAARDVVSYVSGRAHSQLAWFDRGGRPLGVLDASIDLNSPSLSPDDTQVLAAKLKLETGNQIWLSNTGGGTPTLFDTGLPVGGLPLWSWDGKSVIFASDRDLYQVSVNGDHRELLMKATTTWGLLPHDWSNDGQIIFMTRTERTGLDLWRLSLKDGSAIPVLETTADELQGQVSPDCHSIAYASNASGAFEVYVQSFPEPGWKKKISLNGGAQPKWRRDGRELFFLSSDNTLMSVDVRRGSPPDFETPRALFRVDLNETLIFRRNHYAVSHDGSRFLFSAPIAPQPPITIRLNWTAPSHP